MKPPTATRSIAPVGPIGLIWDSTNYSCGYDALLTTLGSVWRDNPTVWSQRLTETSAMLGVWTMLMTNQPNSQEINRDYLRNLLHFQNPHAFPTGARGIRLDNLLMAMTDRRCYGRANTFCEDC
ncbi:hypothetical protein C8R43DRAFT_899833, partial [Mycena crocata]